MPASGRESRRGSNFDGVHATAGAASTTQKQRREKSRSEQYSTSRRGSVKPVQDGKVADTSTGTNASAVKPAAAPQRPGLQSRTHSAPLLDSLSRAGKDTGVEDGRDNADGQGQDGSTMHTPTVETPAADGAMSDGQDEDEIAGVVGAMRNYEPLRSPSITEPIREINIAVIGAECVGKSTFIQRAFDLAQPTNIVARKLQYEGNALLVRLLELPIDDVDIDDDDETVDWPETIQNKRMPRIDGALVLYNVQEKSSFMDVPEMLHATSKSSLPCILVSSMCDAAPNKRELDPAAIEQRAKRIYSNLSTLQTSETLQDSPKKGISMILKAITSWTADVQNQRNASRSSSRRRAHSNAVRPVSPKPPSFKNHARASSEYTGGLQKDGIQHKLSSQHLRHDSSLAGSTVYSSSDRLAVPGSENMYGSFLLEESGSEKSLPESGGSSEQDLTLTPQAVGGATPPTVTTISENGATFDELVDRLLAQPKSKADEKFGAMFLALYRQFAAPGRLLEALVDRFDALEHASDAPLARTSAQLRYLNILSTLISTYPGDLAHPKTKRRVRTFVAKLSARDIFGAAAAQMTHDLDNVAEDDDTDWACNDKDREAQRNSKHWRETMRSTSSLLIDDPNFQFPDGLAGEKQSLASTLISSADDKSSPTSGSPVSPVTTAIEAAQRQAQLLQPIPRQSLTKIQWRALYEQPEDLIARELTRIDWVLFTSIRPRDLVRHVVLSAEQKAKCKDLVNVNRMIDHFNQLASWVSNFILLRDKPKHRALMLEKFMRIARKIRELNNYNSLGAIIAGVRSTCVHRLAATRELISPQVGKDWLRLEMLMGPQKSHGPYRLAWENSSGERIPYLPLHRRDLVSAFEGNKTYFASNDAEERINWRKFEVMGEVIVLMQKAQDIPYKGLGGTRGNEIVKELVLDVKICRDEDELYERSTQLEPSSGGKRRFKTLQNMLSAMSGEGSDV